MKKNSEGELVPDLPTQDRKTTTVINSGGELLKPFLIPKSKLEDNKYFTSSGNSGDYALSNSNYNVNTDKLQDNFAHIWYPPVTLEYFKTKSEKEKGEDGSDKSSLIEKIVLPKGTNIGIVDKTNPNGYENGYVWTDIANNTPFNPQDDNVVISENTALYPAPKMVSITPIPTIVSEGEITIYKGDNAPDKTQYEKNLKEKDGDKNNPLPKGSSVIVEENIDSNKVGEQNAKIKITFENGSSVIVNQKVVVKDRVPWTDIKPIPSLKSNGEIVIYKGENDKPTDEEIKNNISESLNNKDFTPLNNKETIEVLNKFDHDKTGTYEVKIKVTFEDGSSSTVIQKIVVKDKVAQHTGGSSSSSSSSSGNSLTPGENNTGNNDSSNGGNTESGENTSNHNSSGNNSSSSEGGNTSNNNGSSENNSSGENNSSSNGSSVTVNNENHDNSVDRHYEHRNEFKKPSDKSIVTNRSFNRKKYIPKTGVETDSALIGGISSLGAVLISVFIGRKKKEK